MADHNKKKLSDLVAKMIKTKNTCPDGKILNQKTGRCIKIILKKEKECPDGKVLNPKTGRCINKPIEKILSEDKNIKKKVVKKKMNTEKEPIKDKEIVQDKELIKEPVKEEITVLKGQDRKADLIEALEKLRKKEVANKEVWKARAYLTVIKQLKVFEGPIKSYDDLKEIKGIGKGMKPKIEEFFETGKMKQLENYNSTGTIKIMDDLMKIHGIGAVKAKELVEKHNIKSIDELKQHTELLNDIQQIGIKYWEDFDKRIPRKEMEKHDETIHNIVKKVDPKIIATITGSYRRNAPDSGDIDMLLTHPDDPENFEQLFKQIVENFKVGKDPYIKDILALGGKKCMAVCKMTKHQTYRRFDLLYTRKHEYPFALLYFTGSGDFNVRLRNHALSLGYTLSEYGLKYSKGPKKGEFVDHEFETEEDIFDFLGLKFIKPELRNPDMIDKMKK